MSLESAKKMGFAGSMISVIIPLVMIIAAFGLLVALFSNVFSSVTTGVTPSLTNLAVIGGVWGLIIAGGIVALIGYIFFMIAMHRLSQYYNEKAIFKNVLNALIIQIVFSVVLMAALYIYIFSSVGTLISSTPSGSTNTGIVWNLIVVYAIVAVISWIVSIYCGLLYKRSFYALAEKSTVDGFRTTGLLYLIGSALNLLGGSIIIWIAWIIAATSYRKLAPTPQATTSPYTYYSPVQPIPQGPTKHCPACGAENSPDSLYCAKCGRQL